MNPGEGAPHILATDDDPAIRELLTELLEGEGYRVSLSSLRDLAEVARLAPDLILLDYWNPEAGTEWDFLDRLKAEPATARIPIIVLSGAQREARDQASRFAAIDVSFVPKPFDLDELLGEIQRRLPPPPARERG